jgi:hypothetical protein
MQIAAALQPADGSEPRAQTAAPPAAARVEAAPHAASAAGLLPRRGELRGWHLAAPPLLRELATLVRSLVNFTPKKLGARDRMLRCLLHDRVEAPVSCTSGLLARLFCLLTGRNCLLA